MPTWSADWADVQFDLAAASAAAARLEALAGLLEQGHDLLAAHHWRAAAQWAGAHRRRHEAILHDWLQSGVARVGDLRALARELRFAADVAATEQRRRVAGREQWLAEDAAERAAALSSLTRGAS